MKLRLAPRALGEAKRLKTWWLANRPKAPDLFERELDAALERIAAEPQVGVLYEQGKLEVPVRRVLMPKTKTHVYWAIDGDEIVVVSLWGARTRRGPTL
jgi:plasmid stabilization system protein ParE